mgnify:CR=1 FL=1
MPGLDWKTKGPFEARRPTIGGQVLSSWGSANRTVATVILGWLRFIIPLAGIWELWGDYTPVSTIVACFQEGNVVMLKVPLIDKKMVDLPPVIKSLFSLTSASTPTPTQSPPEAVAPPALEGPSLGELLGNLRGQIEQKLNAVKMPEPPKFDLGKLRVRGFYRKKRVSRALVWFEGKLLLVATGDRLGGEIVVESCDFAQEEITIRQLQTGTVYHLSVER